jgi:hypothetical protein
MGKILAVVLLYFYDGVTRLLPQGAAESRGVALRGSGRPALTLWVNCDGEDILRGTDLGTSSY